MITIEQSSPCPDATAEGDWGTADHLVALLNGRRWGARKERLEPDERLNRTAQAWAKAMALSRRLTSDNLFDRVFEEYRPLEFVKLTELVTCGQPQSYQALACLLARPFYRESAFSDYTRIGAGMYEDRSGIKWWCVQLMK